MVMLGYENTLKVTVEDILHHTKAVGRGTRKQLIVDRCRFFPIISVAVGN